MRYPWILSAIVLATTTVSAQSTSFDLVPDVPTDLSAATRLPWEIVAHAAGGAYASTLLLPEDPFVSALHEMDGGDWLLTVSVPTTLGGVPYQAQDVIRFDGATYSLFFDGTANGIPDEADVDAVFLIGGDSGDPVLSLDVPTTIAGTTYLANDLVRFTSGVASLLFDAGTAGVPPGSNVIGADETAAGVALTFDIPTNLDAVTYLPGQLVEWDGAAFSLLHGDPGWPLSSQINGFCLQGGAVLVPGSVPTTVMATKVNATTVNLAWSASCGAATADYGIYEGQIGNWTSHTMVDCSDDGADLNEDISPAAGSRYFLVVPHDSAAVEGSYGTDHSGTERAAGATTCQTTQSLAQCS